MEIIQQAGGIVVGPEHHILVVTNQLGFHTLPKGRQESYDAGALATAQREVHEESGLELHRLQIIQYLGTLIRPGRTAGSADITVEKHIEMFLFTTAQPDLSPVADDVRAARWIAQPQLAEILSWQEEIDFFMEHRDKTGVPLDP